MSVRYEFEHNAETVFAKLTDPQFLVDRCLSLGELEASCEVEEQQDQTVVSLTRKVKTDLPRFLAKMLDPVQTMHMTEQWQSAGEGSWTGEYTFEVKSSTKKGIWDIAPKSIDIKITPPIWNSTMA